MKVTSTGAVEADEVVQVYLSDLESSVHVPRWQLAAFSRVRLQPGQARTVSFTLAARQMSLIDNNGARVLEPGRFRVFVGGSQPDDRSAALAGTRPLSAEFSVTGDEMRLPVLRAGDSIYRTGATATPTTGIDSRASLGTG